MGDPSTIDGITYVEDTSVPYTGSNPELLALAEQWKNEGI
jgi:hypothetical protein